MRLGHAPDPRPADIALLVPGDPSAAGTPAPRLLPAESLVSAALHQAVGTLPDGVREVAEYHLGPVPGASPTGRVPGTGKTVRAGLALASAKAVGGREQDAVSAAVAVELVHNFSLLHDDIIDGDRVRRHQPAAWVAYGVPAAVLAGDALLVLAMGVVAGAGAQAVTMLVEVLHDLMEGQSLDVAFAHRSDVTVEEYWGMAEAKTGSLIAGACTLGAVLAGAPAVHAQALRRFGRHVGVAFQCIDDVLGIWGDPERTGKPVGADLAARRKTLPVLAALAAGGSAARLVGEQYAGTDVLTPQQLGELAVAIEQSGGRAAAEAEAARNVDQALCCLDVAGLAPDGRAELAALATSMIQRHD